MVLLDEVLERINKKEIKREAKEAKWNDKKRKRVRKKGIEGFRKRNHKKQIQYLKGLHKYFLKGPEVVEINRLEEVDERENWEWEDVFIKTGKQNIFAFTLYTQKEWAQNCLDEVKCSGHTLVPGMNDVVMIGPEEKLTRDNIIKYTKIWLVSNFINYFDDCPDVKLSENLESKGG